MNKKYDEEDDELHKSFTANEFKEGLHKIIEEDTWGRGLPKIYMDDDGWLVKHWKDGKIERLQKIK